MTAIETTQPTTLDEFISGLGLEYSARFVPASQVPKERKWDTEDKSPVFHWEITVTRGRTSLVTSYSQGCGHHFPQDFDRKHLGMGSSERTGLDYIRQSAETGTKQEHPDRYPYSRYIPLDPPSLKDVLYCLASDSYVLDYGDFETWAQDMDMDPDSRKAEKTYRDCLSISLKLNSMLGDATLTQLRERFQDY